MIDELGISNLNVLGLCINGFIRIDFFVIYSCCTKRPEGNIQGILISRATHILAIVFKYSLKETNLGIILYNTISILLTNNLISLPFNFFSGFSLLTYQLSS